MQCFEVLGRICLMSQEEDYGLWPLVTPLLSVSDACLAASQRYKETLELIDFTKPLTEQQMDAVRMFDSNGALPFLQEGMWQDDAPYDVCGFLATAGVLEAALCNIVPDTLRYIVLPSGNAAGPGMERECRSVADTKYCHNLFQMEPKEAQQSSSPSRNPAHLATAGLNVNSLTSQQTASVFKSFMNYSADIDILLPMENSSSPLMKLLLEKNSFISNFHSSIERILADYNLDPIPKTPIGLYVFFWWQTNLFNGPGYPSGGHQPPFPYHGACYPSACTNEDIRNNNAEFANKYFQGLPAVVYTAPQLSDAFGDFIISSLNLPANTVHQYQRGVVGCSDDARYSGQWKAENYVMVTVLAIIGALILVGTLMEAVDRSPYIDSSLAPATSSLAHRMLTSFSLIGNLEFIFKVPDKKGSGRLDCLEGMRAMSMTWVILGHNFGFGSYWLHVRNKQYTDMLSSHQAWLNILPKREKNLCFLQKIATKFGNLGFARFSIFSIHKNIPFAEEY